MITWFIIGELVTLIFLALANGDALTQDYPLWVMCVTAVAFVTLWPLLASWLIIMALKHYEKI